MSIQIPEEEKEWQKKSLLFFREAFMHEPREIELGRLTSPLIRALIGEVKEAGYAGEEAACWLPIFAAYRQCFSVKRELEDYEVTRLQDQAYRFEGELRKDRSKKNVLLPLLLNRYICLLDYFTIQVRDPIKAGLVHKRFHEAESEIHTKIYPDA
jgi:hypothetical protein